MHPNKCNNQGSRHVLLGGMVPFLSAILLVAAAFPASAEGQPTERPAGHLTIKQMQVAFIASGALGGGTLNFQGHSYKFKVGGLGVGGFGASKFSASGDVYGLKDVSDFPGAYVAIRTGWALGDEGKGRVWLRNAKGVLLSLNGERQGI